MEILSSILQVLTSAGRLSGFKKNKAEGRGGVSHILFADDALIFCDASVEDLSFILAALVCFECITGLKVNLHKSSLFAIGDVPNAVQLAALIGCRLDSFPTTYLGLPLGARANSKDIWEPVITNLEKKVSSWNSKFLSLGGRITLTKSVLEGLPVYFMSLLKAPVQVSCRMERILNRFLWAGRLDRDKIHWIRWDMVKNPKDLSGLGIHDLTLLNSSLLGKWAWRFGVEKNAWWRRLMVDKCGTGPSDWIPVWNENSAGTSIWRWVIKHSLGFWKFGVLDPGGGLCV
ncbi:Putative ribonuclease H protein At1g65750 [Linum perenne]